MDGMMVAVFVKTASTTLEVSTVTSARTRFTVRAASTGMKRMSANVSFFWLSCANDFEVQFLFLQLATVTSSTQPATVRRRPAGANVASNSARQTVTRVPTAILATQIVGHASAT
jgi:hypothetical protein